MMPFFIFELSCLGPSHLAQRPSADPGKAIAAGQQQGRERQGRERQRREREPGSHPETGQQNRR